MSEHINIDRAWNLIQECSSISHEEAAHLDCCHECRDFLESFVSVARYVGFSVAVPTALDCRVDQERAAWLTDASGPSFNVSVTDAEALEKRILRIPLLSFAAPLGEQNSESGSMWTSSVYIVQRPTVYVCASQEQRGVEFILASRIL